ncbi:winged helix-turn-helix domain-containing protein [Streptomyces sp. NPDC057686]|uniref:winged helix-turn-helix domain-containing protein n=1 Tax=Streptomyces sp. NPDC057686 TaxID=3346212 RepID=UPI0036CD201F
MEDQVWTASRVATLIGRKFHVSYSVSGATRLMHRLGFTPRVPARRVAERDEQAVSVWCVRLQPSSRGEPAPVVADLAQNAGVGLGTAGGAPAGLQPPPRGYPAPVAADLAHNAGGGGGPAPPPPPGEAQHDRRVRVGPKGLIGGPRRVIDRLAGGVKLQEYGSCLLAHGVLDEGQLPRGLPAEELLPPNLDRVRSKISRHNPWSQGGPGAARTSSSAAGPSTLGGRPPASCPPCPALDQA